MAETDLNKAIKRALVGLDPRRCENAVDTGTPDVHYVDGWIESKAIVFPARGSTKLQVRHYVPEQRAWHVRRCAAGGLVHVVVWDKNTLDHETLVFNAALAAQHLGVDWTLAEARARATLHMLRWDGLQFRRFILRERGKHLVG